MKAGTLSGRSGLMFWRNSQSGALEVTKRKKAWGTLNKQLHATLAQP